MNHVMIMKMEKLLSGKKAKCFFSILILGLFPFLIHAQLTDITKINDQLTERPWLDHSVHEIYGYRITQEFGERYSPDRHSNLGSITSIAYLDPGQLEEKYGRQAKGGAIELFLTRAMESRANFKYFFVVIRGEDDKKKLMEIDLDNQPPQLPEANGWWNYTLVLLPEAVASPFYVYVNDRQSQYLSDYKFDIQTITNK